MTPETPPRPGAPEQRVVVVREAVAREEVLPPRPEVRGPAPIGTLVVVGLVVLSVIWLWMLVLGVQQGRV